MSSLWLKDHMVNTFSKEVPWNLFEIETYRKILSLDFIFIAQKTSFYESVTPQFEFFL